MSNWKAGDKAVCVDDSPHKNRRKLGQPTGLKAGTIYLVLDIVINDDGLGLVIAGVPTGLQNTTNNQPIGWRANRFRKVVTATERAQIESHAEQ